MAIVVSVNVRGRLSALFDLRGGIVLTLLLNFVLLISSGCNPSRNSASSPSVKKDPSIKIKDVRFEEREIAGILYNGLIPGRYTIHFSIYDRAGHKLGNATDTIADLGVGETWHFKAYVWDRDAGKYAFEGVTCKYGAVETIYETRAEAQERQRAIDQEERNAFLVRKAADEALAAAERGAEPVKPAQISLERSEERVREQLQQRFVEHQRDLQRVKVVTYQLNQASNGLPSFQYEIGKRYLNGDGLEANQALALHWLRSACTNGSEQASNLLVKAQGTLARGTP